MIGKSAPITIKLLPTSPFPAKGVIMITDLKLESLLYGQSCASYIVKCAPFYNDPDCSTMIACSYTYPTLITISPNGAQTTSEIVIELSKVVYPNSWKATSFTVKTEYDTFTYCRIGLDMNAPTKLLESGIYNNFKAESPSDFASTLRWSFTPTTLQTCTLTSISWSANLYTDLPIFGNYGVKIEFFAKDGKSINLKMDLNSIDSTTLKNLQTSNANQITGKFMSAFSNTISFSINKIILPSTTVKFYSIITTYTAVSLDDSEIAYRGSTPDISADIIPITSSNHIISTSTSFTVSEPNSYSIIVKGGCASIDTPIFRILFPSYFSSSDPACPSVANCIVPVSDQSGSISSNTLVKLSFTLIGPICEKAKPIVDPFTIDIYEGSIGVAARITAVLDSNIEYERGLMIFTVIPKDPIFVLDDCRNIAKACAYVFEFKVIHPIPSGGRIDFMFNSNFACVSVATEVVDASIDGVPFSTTGQCNSATHTVSIKAGQILLSGIIFKAAFKSIKNPLVTQTYNGFFATSYSSGNCVIDESSEQTVIIDQPAEAIVTVDLSNYVNLNAPTTYKINFKSDIFNLPPSSTTHHLIMKVPSQVKNCAIPQSTSELALIAHTSTEYTFEVLSGNRNAVIFTIDCTNPTVTLPTDPFTFVLCTGGVGCDVSGNKVLVGSQRVQTTKGVEVLINNLVSTSTYPSAATTVSFEIERNINSDSIRKLEIYNYYFDTSVAMCNTASSIPPETCNWDSTAKTISFTYPSNINNKQVIVSGLKAINPSTYAQGLNARFSIKSYQSTVLTPPIPVVDESVNNKALPVDCDYPCATCTAPSYSVCNSCVPENIAGEYYYYYPDPMPPTNSKCVLMADTDDCKTGYVKDSGASTRKCNKCDLKCLTCRSIETFCVECNTGQGYALNGLCVSASQCTDGNYRVTSGGKCVPCDSNCAKCLLTKEQCIECPEQYFLVPPTCVRCTNPCFNCISTPTHCTSCYNGEYLEVTTCVTTCSPGRSVIGNACLMCDPLCNGCTGAIDHCILCTGAFYVYQGGCYLNCPLSTTKKAGTDKICVSCTIGCDSCTLDSSEKETCLQCSASYKHLQGRCYMACPSGYIASEDQLSCVKTPEAASESFNYLPFPHFMAVVVLAIVVAATQSRNSKALFVSNLIVVLNYVIMSAYICQLVFSFNKESVTTIITAIVFAIQVILNVAFLIPYKKIIAKDEGFISDKKITKCIKGLILTLSTTLSFQSCRMFYSGFLGFNVFLASFKDFGNILKPLNQFSVAQALLVHCLTIVVDILSLLKLSRGNNLFVTVIESLGISLLILILLCYEIKNTLTTKEELNSRNGDYFNDKSSSKLLEENEKSQLRKEIIDTVFERIGMNNNFKKLSQPKKKPKRRQSFSFAANNNKEDDPRRTSSYPCSPKTRKDKEVPLEQYGIDNKRILAPSELADNVYSDSVPPKDPSLAISVETSHIAVQTPPFRKIAAFKQHMQIQKRRQQKMFATDNGSGPLEIIEESPEEYAQNRDLRRTRTMEPLLSQTPTITSMNDSQKKPGNLLKSRNSQQAADEIKDIDMSKPLKPINRDSIESEKLGHDLRSNAKIPDVFDSDNDIKFTSTKADNKQQSRGYSKEERPQSCNSEDLRGSFEKDDDGYLIIRENSEGILVDLKGRVVNNCGYLIDKDGNIMNRKGEFIMSKTEFDNIIKNEGNKQEIATQKNKLFKEDSANKKDVYEETKIESINPSIHWTNKGEDITEDNKSSKSVSLDSIMQDTPSNYDFQNMRCNPQERVKQKQLLTQESSLYDKGDTGEQLMNRAIREQNANRRKRKRMNPSNLSTKKGIAEKAFTMQKKIGFASDEDDKEAADFKAKKTEEIKNYELPDNAVRFNEISKASEFHERTEFGSRDRNSRLPELKDEDTLVRPTMSRASNAASIAKTRELESIYLQRIGSTAKVKKLNKKGEQEITAEHDDIGSLLSENYDDMKNTFKRRANIKLPKKNSAKHHLEQ